MSQTTKLGWRIDVTDEELSLINLGLSKAHQAQDILGQDLYEKLIRLEEEIRNLSKGNLHCSTTDSLNPMRMSFEADRQ